MSSASKADRAADAPFGRVGAGGGSPKSRSRHPKNVASTAGPRLFLRKWKRAPRGGKSVQPRFGWLSGP
eukprot:3867030-Prymnesium_polylepis.1